MKFENFPSIAIAAVSLWVGGIGAQGATHTVIVRDFFFNPTNITVLQGDTIRWTNMALIAHDTTQGQATTPDAQRLWKSPNLPGLVGTYQFRFTNTGVYPYICLQHIVLRPQQTGTVTVAEGNLPPEVTMTAPAGGSRHPSPPNFSASATATDPDGTVTNVFFTAFTSSLGTVDLGSTPVAPYTLRVTNLPPASYQFRAVAMDNEGLSSTSAMVSVLIAVPAPLVMSPPVLNASNQVQFDLTTTLGMSYVVEESRHPGGPWSPVSTNTAPGTTLKITRPFDSSSPTQKVYRAFIQP